MEVERRRALAVCLEDNRSLPCLPSMSSAAFCLPTRLLRAACGGPRIGRPYDAACSRAKELEWHLRS